VPPRAEFGTKRPSLLAVIVSAVPDGVNPAARLDPAAGRLGRDSQVRTWSGSGIEGSGLTSPDPAKRWPLRRERPRLDALPGAHWEAHWGHGRALMTLAEIARCCSAKFPTLGTRGIVGL
jgi:hypothetical protein